jgi:predicted alpha/beta superfamily hydrolase
VPASKATLRTHERFRSRFLPDERDITVYLPPGYEARGDTQYPVLYLHDGQNLFEPDKAFKPGEHWRVPETASVLIEARRIEPLIVVGIGNTGAQRLHEYTPTHDRRRGGGEAQAYGRLIVEELKPFVDATYATRRDGARTGIGGSSLGGLVSLYLGLAYPNLFTRLAVLSPSVWWDRRSILRDVRESRGKPAPRDRRLWLDMGTREGRYHVDNLRLLKAGLINAGWVEGDTMHYEEVQGGTHSEADWAARLDRVLEWLYPRDSPLRDS